MKVDTQFDLQLEKIKGLNKNWLPWVGRNYASSKNRTLIIGESHYLTPDVDVNQFNYQRKIVEKEGMMEGEMFDQDPNLKKYIPERTKRLEACLSINPHDKIQKRNLWSNVGYYNLIQLPLGSRDAKDRPVFEYFLEGWNIFFEVIKILKPHFCLMNGVQSFHHLDEKFSTPSGYEVLEKKVLKKIGATYPRKIILQKMGSNEKIKLVFIQHTSRGLVIEDWKKFIDDELYA